MSGKRIRPVITYIIFRQPCDNYYFIIIDAFIDIDNSLYYTFLSYIHYQPDEDNTWKIKICINLSSTNYSLKNLKKLVEKINIILVNLSKYYENTENCCTLKIYYIPVSAITLLE